MPQSGYIYAIGAVGTSYVKIGSTTGAVQKSLHALQTGHPSRLEILAAVHVETDLRDIEQTLHHFLVADCQRGEWFALAMDQSQLEALIARAIQGLEAARRITARQPATTVGERIKRQRLSRGYTQAELAERAGVKQSLISRLESGLRTNPGADVVRGLAKALGCTADYLVGMYEDEQGEVEPTGVAMVGA
jgi:DNA-binding XRE family transcriptional regulator